MSSEEEKSDRGDEDSGASSEPSEWSGDEDDDSQSSHEVEGSDKDNDGEEEERWSRRRGRTLLWFCQEGQIRMARKRFDFLLRQERRLEREKHGSDDNPGAKGTPSDWSGMLQREVFQSDRSDKNYALHELLMGGTSDRNAYRLIVAILDYVRSFPVQEVELLSAQPPSHGRMALHWAAWGNAPPEILHRLVRAYPEALMVRDRPRHRVGFRTPVETAKRYFGEESPSFRYLQSALHTWKIHRIQYAVHLCVLRTFEGKLDGAATRVQPDAASQPFCNKDRKRLGIKPRAWFPLSVLGYLFQREMKPLALQILSFLGPNISVKNKNKNKNNSKRTHTQQDCNATSSPKRTKV